MGALRYAFDFVQHWLSSNTRHGTHSPFVYRLLDEVVYASHPADVQIPLRFSSQQLNHLIQRVILDHGAKQLLVCNFNDPIILGPAAVIIFKHPQTLAPEHYLKDLLAAARPDTLLIIPEIYHNQSVKKQWDAIQKHPKVTVSIDFFHVGLVYFHQGQAKENFKIRI